MAKKKEAGPVSTVRGVVDRVIFRNDESGWTVARINDMMQTIVVGSMASVRIGDTYEFRGAWIKDPKYGDQLKFVECELVMPTNKDGIALYLSRISYGVGPVKARQIVEALGTDCLQIIREKPDRLKELPFLSEQQAKDILLDLEANSAQAALAGMICRHGIGMGMVKRIYDAYGADSIRVVKENPYVLCDDLWGIGFKKADAVAMTVGIPENSPYRVQSAIMFALRSATNEGHVYMRPNMIIHSLIGKGGIIENSGVSTTNIAEAARDLISAKRLIREGDAIYLLPLYYAECTVADGIVKALTRPRDRSGHAIDPERVNTLIGEFEVSAGLICAPEQRSAIVDAVTQGVSIITGGPGTGKTFTINGICHVYRHLFPGKDIHLAAPTGRAAKRMNESTGREAKTIHRLLCYSPADGGFTVNGDNPLPGGLLIVDEVSMMDVELAACLLEATGYVTMVFVGDIDQLPSVGAGSVLRDLIASQRVPTTRLSFNYRQAGGSQIAEKASQVARGIDIDLANIGDFEFVEAPEPEKAAEEILHLVEAAHASGMDPLDWQVLLPMRRGSCGVNLLNDMIREAVNPMVVGEKGRLGFRVKDKVMVIKNNYKLDVYNGDIGVVKEVDEDDNIIVRFGRNDGDESGYRKFDEVDADILTLAYAGTIHKSQGSESPLIILGLTRQHWIMLQRNLIYTGMTRASGRLVLVGNTEAVSRAIKNNKVEERYSLLKERIETALRR